MALFPMELTRAGRLVVATAEVPSRDRLDQLEQRLGRPLDLVLTTGNNFAFAIQRGYQRLAEAEAEGRPRLGQILLERQIITPAQLHEALKVQRHSYTRMGDILLEMGFIDPATLGRPSASIAPTATWLCEISGAKSLYYPGPVGPGPEGARRTVSPSGRSVGGHGTGHEGTTARNFAAQGFPGMRQCCASLATAAFGTRLILFLPGRRVRPGVRIHPAPNILNNFGGSGKKLAEPGTPPLP